MSELIRVPDIGNGQGEVIELLVKVGDKIEAEQSLMTLESDKASMEIPAPKAGVVKSIKVKVGDTIGKVGNTGRSYGAHLHFEIIINGSTVDPLAWMRKNAGRYSY